MIQLDLDERYLFAIGIACRSKAELSTNEKLVRDCQVIADAVDAAIEERQKKRKSRTRNPKSKPKRNWVGNLEKYGKVKPTTKDICGGTNGP